MFAYVGSIQNLKDLKRLGGGSPRERDPQERGHKEREAPKRERAPRERDPQRPRESKVTVFVSKVAFSFWGWGRGSQDKDPPRAEDPLVREVPQKRPEREARERDPQEREIPKTKEKHPQRPRGCKANLSFMRHLFF